MGAWIYSLPGDYPRQFGERAFVVAGPATWNQLPCSIRNSSSVNSFTENIYVFIYNLTVHYIFIAACTVSLVLVCGLYGALELVTVLQHLRNCCYIIISIINFTKLQDKAVNLSLQVKLVLEFLKIARFAHRLSTVVHTRASVTK